MKIKFGLEIILVLFAIVIFYQIPEFMENLTSTFIGRLLLTVGVLVVYMKYGKNAGILAALVVVVLIMIGMRYEGFENGGSTEDDDDDVDAEVEPVSDIEEDDTDNLELNATSNRDMIDDNDLLEMDEYMTRKPKDPRMEVDPTANANGTNQSSSVPKPTAAKVSEGFSNYY